MGSVLSITISMAMWKQYSTEGSGIRSQPKNDFKNDYFLNDSCRPTELLIKKNYSD
jgi:hypothetical protein